MSDRTFISFYLRYNTMHVFYRAVREIGKPAFVKFLISGDDMKMVMQPHDKKEFVSFRVPQAIYHPQYHTHKCFQIRSKAFCELLASRLEWDSTRSYRIPGTIYPNQQLVLFDLSAAEQIGELPRVEEAI